MKIVSYYLLGLAFITASCGGLGGPAAPTVMQVDDLYKELKESPDAFRSKYLGKDVVVLGKTGGGKFDPKFEFTSLDTQSVRLKGASDDVLYAVNCEVEKADGSKFEGVDSDMALTVRGKLSLKDDKYIYLRPCTRDFRK